MTMTELKVKPRVENPPMKIKIENPPNINEIRKVFGGAVGKEVIFAWGDTIYNPSGMDIPPELMAHEKVHGDRQRGDVLGWWRRYLMEPDFRFVEELIAHKVEYQYLLECGNRQQRRRALKTIAKRLSGPLYNRACTFKQAVKFIQEP